jgi:isopentenyl-diphosphate delta-isomerase
MPITPATATHSPSNGTADAILLELVDEDGVTIGTAEKLAAHQPPGQLHRAFSVFLFDEYGRLLEQVPLPRRVVEHLLRPPVPR